MKINRIIFAALGLAMSAPALGQQSVDSLPGKVTNAVDESFFVNQSFWLNCQNSAGMCFNKVNDFSKVELFAGYGKGDYRKVYQPESTQFYGFSSKGIKKLGRLKFMGSFVYNREVNKKVEWSQMMDVERPNPLIISDFIGGDWKRDRYDLGLKIGSDPLFGWLRLGLGAKYAVAHGGRDNDPRPKSLIKDLSLTPSVMLELSPSHVFGFSYAVRNYRQDIDIINTSGVGSSTIFKILGLQLLENPLTKSSMEYRIDGLDQFVDFQYNLRQQGWNTYAKVSYGLVTEEDIMSPYKASVDTTTNNVSHIPVNEVDFAEAQYQFTWGAEVRSGNTPYSMELTYGYYDADAYSYLSSQVEYMRETQFVDIALATLLNNQNPSQLLGIHLGAKYSWQSIEQALYAEEELKTLKLNLSVDKAFNLFRLQSTIALLLEWNNTISSTLNIEPKSEFIPVESAITTPVVRNSYYYESSDWASANVKWNVYLPSVKKFKPYIGVNVTGLKVINSVAFEDDYRVFTAINAGFQF